MADKLAKEVDDEALANVDQAVDSIIAAFGVLDEELPKVQANTVPQKAAVDAIKDLLDTAVKPYTADIVKALQVFGE